MPTLYGSAANVAFVTSVPPCSHNNPVIAWNNMTTYLVKICCKSYASDFGSSPGMPIHQSTPTRKSRPTVKGRPHLNIVNVNNARVL